MKKFTGEHEWIELNGNIGTIGVSNYAQKQLGDVVYVSFTKQVNDNINAGDTVAEIESVKSVSPVYSPVSGKLIELNNAFLDEANSILINNDPFGAGWIFKLEITDKTQLDKLMTEDQYNDFIKTL